MKPFLSQSLHSLSAIDKFISTYVICQVLVRVVERNKERKGSGEEGRALSQKAARKATLKQTLG